MSVSFPRVSLQLGKGCFTAGNVFRARFVCAATSRQMVLSSGVYSGSSTSRLFSTSLWVRGEGGVKGEAERSGSGDKRGVGTQGTVEGDKQQNSVDRKQDTSHRVRYSEKPPAPQASAVTKGKLLSTPSRLLKLLLPLTTTQGNTDRGSIEPLALLIHPRQPLSYLERLIQAELPQTSTPHPHPPTITFRAVEGRGDVLSLRSSEASGGANKSDHSPTSNSDATAIVRWSGSTEVGDFVRDASRGHEFLVFIENGPSVPVTVPSFKDRTHYLRQRFRVVTQQIKTQAELKSTCDNEAHRGAQRVAMGGFAGLMTWWGGVYWLTFKTPLGWDVMEPVTYLVGLSTVMGSYLWFLYHNREVSYRSVLHLTVSKRQLKLYNETGFDLDRWEDLVDEGKALRREIRNVAVEYDVEWDEDKDEAGGKKVQRLLSEDDRKGKLRNGNEEEEDEEDEEDDEKDIDSMDSETEVEKLNKRGNRR